MANAYRTREEMEAGEPCRSCGLPLVDNLGDWAATLHRTEAEQAAYDVAEAAYRRKHADCESHRWSMSGSRAMHCGYCCPSHPISPRQIEDLRRILSGITVRPNEQDVWHLTLTCDHVVERTQHRSNERWSGSLAQCPDCVRQRGVVTAQVLGPAATESPSGQRRSLEDNRVKELAAATRELHRMRRESRRLEQRVEALQRAATLDAP